MLEGAHKAHRKRSSGKKGRGLQKTTRCSSPQGLLEAGNKLVTTTYLIHQLQFVKQEGEEETANEYTK